MKMILGFLIFCFALMAPTISFAGGGGFVKQKFQQQIYFDASSAGKLTNSGFGPSSPKSFADQDVWAIPAGVVIEKVYVIIDLGLTGGSSPSIDIGDDDTAAGFCPTASVTEATPAMYCWDAKNAGAYLRIQTAGVTDPADIFVVPSAKYYPVSGKEVKLDMGGTATAGKFRVVIEGYWVGV